MKKWIAAFGLAAIAAQWAAAVAMATEAPGHEPTDRVAAQASDAVVGVLVSSIRAQEPGNQVLRVAVETQRQLWGAATSGVIEATYREYELPAIPEGVGVCFANYTGSGIEWEAKTNTAYVCFLKREADGFALLRLEPAENAAKAKALHEESKKADWPKCQ